VADTRYLKKRRQGWYFQLAIPRNLRGEQPWGEKPVIIKSLHTADLVVAQRKRWTLLEEYQEAFARAAGDIPLTKAEINQQAWVVYQDMLRDLEAKPPVMEPQEDESPEEMGLINASWLYEEALEQKDYEIAEPTIREICERTGAVIAKKSETWKLLGAAVCNAQWSAVIGRLKALRDEPSEPPVNFVPGGIDRVTLQPVVHIPRAKVATGKGGPRFSEATAAFLADRQRDPNAALIGQSEQQYRMTFRLFQEFTHNPPVSAVDRGVADGFIKAISTLPPAWGKAKETKGLSLAEVLAKSANAEERLTNKTLNRHISSLSVLFKWIQRKPDYKFTAENPFSNQWLKEASKGATKWLPYRVDELNKLFAGKPPAELRWIMLTALFSGMRLNEICQLRTEDVQRELRIWYLNVGAEHEGQRVKSEAGFRRVPIHGQITKAGFLDYVKELPAGQLWPGLKPGGPDRKLSWYVTRAFTRYRRKIGVTRPRVNFHSLRKNFVTCLDNADGVSQADIAAIVGHERGFTFDRYSEGKGLSALKQIVEKVRYPGLKL
jgi:integrase